MENKQFIISIGREYGSAGHEIAEKLAEIYNLPLYDSNLLQEIAEEKNVHVDNLKKYDESPKFRLRARTVKGLSNSPQVNIAQMQFDYLRKKAQSGESFVVVGRCSEEVLKEYKGLISIFILGDMEKKVERICRIHNISAKEAEIMIKIENKKRKMYHNYHTEGKWGDSRNYHFSINSSPLGVEETITVLKDYIDRRIKLL